MHTGQETRSWGGSREGRQNAVTRRREGNDGTGRVNMGKCPWNRFNQELPVLKKATNIRKKEPISNKNEIES